MTKNDDGGLGLKLIVVNGKNHSLVGLVNASHFQVCLKNHNFKPFQQCKEMDHLSKILRDIQSCPQTRKVSLKRYVGT